MPQPTPGRFFQTINAYQQTAALKASLELEVFTAIGAGCVTAESLADRCKTSVKGMRVLCDFLVIQQFLTKEGNHYGLAPDAAMFLDKNSRMYVGGTAGFLLSPPVKQFFDDFAAVVRKGGTVMAGGGTVSYEHPVWKEFARSMIPLMMAPAEAIAAIVKANERKPMKVLDLAAGHGVFGITIARRNPMGFFGMVHVLEGTSVSLARATLGSPSSARLAQPAVRRKSRRFVFTPSRFRRD